MLCSKPCKECLKTIKNVGIKKIAYFDENNTLVIRNINDIDEKECYLTSSQRQLNNRKVII